MLRQKDEKWGMKSRVWVEMLSYTADHCRAVGEFITFVWLLMAHFGICSQFLESRRLGDRQKLLKPKLEKKDIMEGMRACENNQTEMQKYLWSPSKSMESHRISGKKVPSTTDIMKEIRVRRHAFDAHKSQSHFWSIFCSVY